MDTAARPTSSDTPDDRPARPGFDRVAAVADAILYEGYLLYPYRRSSPKNRVRWQFGVLAPPAWAEANCPAGAGVAGSAESWWQQTECLLHARADTVVRVRVRCLQLQHKGVERRLADGRHIPVECLDLDGAADPPHLAFDEAVPRETDIAAPLADLLAGPRAVPVEAPGGEDAELLTGGAGRVVRTRRPLRATATLSAELLADSPALYRLRVRVENTDGSVGPDIPRDEALRHALIAAHTLVGADGAEFLSLTEPPARAEEHARACRNVRTFPVLAGETGSADLVLSSPIILPDHPQVAPESPGDLHDAAEIDEILSLRTLLLTDEEKREARATDRRAAEILDRVDAMPPQVFSRLHGAIRSLRPAPPGPTPARSETQSETPPAPVAPRRPAWWQEGGDEGLSPATDSVDVDGVPVAKGSRVRLRPRAQGADVHDMFLADRTAHVQAVLHDVDGSLHIAVTLDDDPAAELHSWYGRFHYFRPDEVRPLTTVEEDGAAGSAPPAKHPPQEGPKP